MRIFWLILVISTSALLNSCEVFRIGEAPKVRVVQPKADQNSPFGAVYLFKNELDTNNVAAAAQILAKIEGSKYLAMEKVEMYDEVARIGRLIEKKPITNVVTSVKSSTAQNLSVEFDYIQILTFSTVKIGENWFISGIEEEPIVKTF